MLDEVIQVGTMVLFKQKWKRPGPYFTAKSVTVLSKQRADGAEHWTCLWVQSDKAWTNTLPAGVIVTFICEHTYQLVMP